MRDEVHPLAGSGVALAGGLVGALWAGLGVAVALGRAFAEIWGVPRVEQASGLKARARRLAVLVILGVTLVAATAAAGLVPGAHGGTPTSAAGAPTRSLDFARRKASFARDDMRDAADEPVSGDGGRPEPRAKVSLSGWARRRALCPPPTGPALSGVEGRGRGGEGEGVADSKRRIWQTCACV